MIGFLHILIPACRIFAMDKNLLVRRMYVVANHVLPEADAPKKNDGAVQLDLFTDYAAEEKTPIPFMTRQRSTHRRT